MDKDMQRQSAEGDVEVREPSSLARLMLDLDEQWPSLKFLGFGCYYAWIWLSYNSSVLVAGPQAGGQPADTVFAMYLASTTALSIMLILSSVFTKISTRLVESRTFVFAMGVVAAMGTVIAAVCSASGPADPAFIAASVLTGAGTAWVALRLGGIYSTVSARQAVMYTTASFLFACMLYFVAVGLPSSVGLAFTASLPVIAAVCTMTVVDEPVMRTEVPQRTQKLPKGFFFRLVAAIAVFSVIVGVTRGFSTLTQTVATLDSQGVIIAFGTAVIAMLLFVLVGLTGRDFDISRLYYPIIILAAAGILVVPLVGDAGAFENQVIGIAYSCFIMLIWCLLAHVSYMSGLSAVRVFGFGRGASALGTTVGWLLGSQLIASQESNPSLMVGVSIAMVFALLIISMLVFNDRAIGQVLKRTAGIEEAPGDGVDAGRVRDIFPVSLLEGSSGGRDEAEEGPSEQHQAGAWARRCHEIADLYKLSPRERDVLFLLAKGRTIDYVAGDLGISFNTAKSHIRHVYVKIGVHTRQELLDLIEQGRMDRRGRQRQGSSSNGGSGSAGRSE